MIKRILLGTTALVALGTAPAHAAPALIVTNFALFLSTVTGTFVATSTAAFILDAALVAGSIGLSYALAPGAQKNQPIDQGSMKSDKRLSDSPVIRGVGRCLRAGVVVFEASSGSFSARVQANTGGRCDGVESVFIGGREVIVDSNDRVRTGQWGRAGSDTWCYIRHQMGTGSEVADEWVRGRFPNLWTTDHRGIGISQTTVRFESPGFENADTYGALYSGGIPDVSYVRREEPVYDPRDPVQDPDDPDTWTWTDNSVLVCRHIMHVFDALKTDDWDWDYIALQADLADDLVTTRTGAEKRSRVCGSWSEETARGTIVRQFLDSAGCELIERPGDKLGIQLVMDDPGVDFTFEPRDIVSIRLQSGPEGVDAPNVCVVKYLAPQCRYEVTEIDMTGIAWARDEADIAATGRKELIVELQCCPSAAQAMRIARRKFFEARADRGVAMTNLVGWGVWGCDTASIPYPDLGVTLKCRLGVATDHDDDGTVEIPFTVVPTMPAWDPVSDEALPPPAVMEIDFPDAEPTPPPPASIAVLASGHVRVALDMPDDADSVEACWRKFLSPDRPTQWRPYESTTKWGTIEEDLRGATIEARARYKTDDGDESNFSSIASFVVGALDDVAPPPPTITAEIVTSTMTITVTAPDSIHCAEIVTTGNGSPGTVPVSPGDVITWTTALAGPWTATARNGAGLVSATVSAP